MLTALCGYAVLYLAARDLEPAGFSVFGVFWGAFGLVTGAANGLLQEATREVRSAALHRGGVGPAHASDAGGGDGRCRRGGGDRRQLAAVVADTCSSNRVWLSVALLSVGTGRVLPARHPAGNAGRRRPVDAVRRADGHRRGHPGGGRGDHLRDRLGARRLPVGDRRRSGGVADHADRLAGDARGGRLC